MGPLRRPQSLAPVPRLVVCPSCSADCVVPVDWNEHDEQNWWIRLRCGACGESREVVVPDATAKRYDVELGRGMDEIRAARHRLELEQMAAQADVFAKALQLDLLDAADFAASSGDDRAPRRR